MLLKQTLYNLLILTLVVLIAAALLSLLSPASYAQEATGEPSDAPLDVADEPPIEGGDFVPPTSPVNTLLNNLLNAVAVSVYLPSAAGVMLFMTNATKMIMPKKVPSQMIQLFWMLIIWGLFILAQAAGYSDTQVNAWLEGATKIGYILLGGSVSQIAASNLYDKAAAKNLPITGYSRSQRE